MRPVFLNDGSLLVGQTGRGWGAWGGQEGSLQRIIYDGKSKSGDIFTVKANKKGLEVILTNSLDEKVSKEQLMNSTCFFMVLHEYRKIRLPEHDRREDKLEDVSISEDRKSFVVSLAEFEKSEKWTDRIYHLVVNESETSFGSVPSKKSLTAYYTLRSVPE